MIPKSPPRDSDMIWPHSGDFDILILFLLHSSRFVDILCLINNGNMKGHQIIDMSTNVLSAIKCQALADIHVFSVNDYISSFFEKEKSIF